MATLYPLFLFHIRYTLRDEENSNSSPWTFGRLFFSCGVYVWLHVHVCLFEGRYITRYQWYFCQKLCRQCKKGPDWESHKEVAGMWSHLLNLSEYHLLPRYLLINLFLIRARSQNILEYLGGCFRTFLSMNFFPKGIIQSKTCAMRTGLIDVQPSLRLEPVPVIPPSSHSKGNATPEITIVELKV